jgi:hypothetical protein
VQVLCNLKRKAVQEQEKKRYWKEKEHPKTKPKARAVIDYAVVFAVFGKAYSSKQQNKGYWEKD